MQPAGALTGSSARRKNGWATATIGYAPVAIQFVILLVLLKANRKLEYAFPHVWFVVPLFLSVALCRIRIAQPDQPLIRLWQLVGLLSAIYSVLHYPLIPLANSDPSSVGLYVVLLIVWALSICAGVACFWIPSLSVLAPAFLVWVNSMAGLLTGLHYSIDIDIRPLTEVSMCIALGLLVGRVIWDPIELRFKAFAGKEISRAIEQRAAIRFSDLLLLLAIAVHLSNYFWSFIAKMKLPGPFGAWAFENDPAYIFLAALDDGHILFSGFPALVAFMFGLLTTSHVVTNFLVLAIQAAAVAAFFFPKRIFVVLLVFFDIMHVSIIAIVGANFWPWIMLNVAIAFVVAGPKYVLQPVSLRLAATFFIVVAPYFARIIELGWFDSGANNRLSFVAVDRTGEEYPVPANFFTFYSYPLGHMDYGLVDHVRAVPTQSPNGGAFDYQIFKAGRACDFSSLTPRPELPPLNGGGLSQFVRNYHRLALSTVRTLGFFPYDLYPHHFYVPPSRSAKFARLDMEKVAYYIYRQETVCLSFADGSLQRNVIASADYRIDISDGRAGKR